MWGQRMLPTSFEDFTSFADFYVILMFNEKKTVIENIYYSFVASRMLTAINVFVLWYTTSCSSSVCEYNYY